MSSDNEFYLVSSKHIELNKPRTSWQTLRLNKTLVSSMLLFFGLVLSYQSEFAAAQGLDRVITVEKEVNDITGRGTVTSQPTGINCGPSCEIDFDEFTFGETLSLRASPIDGSRFEQWSTTSPFCNGDTALACEAVVLNDFTFTAIFELVTDDTPPDDNTPPDDVTAPDNDSTPDNTGAILPPINSLLLSSESQ